MKKTSPSRQTICLKFCAYYKPGKNEELECRGYGVVNQLMQSGKTGVLDTFEKETDLATAETIVREVCVNCDFYANDCDFIQDRSAPPCGGMVLLSQLLSTKRISLEDLIAAGRRSEKKT